MKLTTEKGNVSSNISTSATVQLSNRREDLAIWIKMLIEKNYTNGPKACVREIISNAFDAQMMNGDTRKIYIKAPTSSDRSFVVIDHGPGMSPKTIEEVYMFLGRSDKRESENAVGAFGLGSKTPLTVNSMFMVETRVLSACKTYCTEYGYIFALVGGVIEKQDLYERQVSAEKHGTTITVQLKDSIDEWPFFTWIVERCQCNFDKVELDCGSNEDYLEYLEVNPYSAAPVIQTDEYEIYHAKEGNGFEGSEGLGVLVGTVLYKHKPGYKSLKDLEEFQEGYDISSYSYRGIQIVLKFNASVIELPNSREEISDTDLNKRLIEDRLKPIAKVLRDYRANLINEAETLLSARENAFSVLYCRSDFTWRRQRFSFGYSSTEEDIVGFSSEPYLGGEQYRARNKVKNRLDLEDILKLKKLVFSSVKPSIKHFDKFLGASEPTNCLLVVHIPSREKLRETCLNLKNMIGVDLEAVGGPKIEVYCPQKAAPGKLKPSINSIVKLESGEFQVKREGALRIIHPCEIGGTYIELGRPIAKDETISAGAFFTCHSQERYCDMGPLANFLQLTVGLNLYHATPKAFEELKEGIKSEGYMGWIPVNEAFQMGASMIQEEFESDELFAQTYMYCADINYFKIIHELLKVGLAHDPEIVQRVQDIERLAETMEPLYNVLRPKGLKLCGSIYDNLFQSEGGDLSSLNPIEQVKKLLREYPSIKTLLLDSSRSTIMNLIVCINSGSLVIQKDSVNGTITAD